MSRICEEPVVHIFLAKAMDVLICQADYQHLLGMPKAAGFLEGTQHLQKC